MTNFLPRKSSIFQCRNCNRYLSGSDWVAIPFDSPQFVNFCVSCLGSELSKQVERADMIYSSMTSRSFSISIQMEQTNGEKRQTNVWFDVEGTICDYCKAILASHDVQQWTSTVVLKSNDNRREPIEWLEKEIEKNYKDSISDAAFKSDDENTIIYQFVSKSTAFRFVSFIKRTIAAQIEEVIEKVPKENGSYDFNLTFNVNLPGIWEDDLVIMPDAICALNGSGKLCICKSITDDFIFVDPETGIQSELKAEEYWTNPFPAILKRSSMIPISIVDVTPFGPKSGRLQMCDLEVNIPKSEESINAKSHLGNDLQNGDFCFAYDLRNGIDDLSNFPDIVVVKKIDKNAFYKAYNQLNISFRSNFIQEDQNIITQKNLNLNLQKLSI